MKFRFDEAYYQRFYRDPATRISSPRYYAKLVAYIAAYSELLDLRVRSTVDLGCGTGLFRKPLRREFPNASYTGVEASEYAANKYGWTCGSLADYESEQTFDLVICHDVLQYLDRREAARAIENFDRLSASLVYFSVLTEEDWERNCDQSRTDGDVYLRPASWYRKRLRPLFINLGGGLYVKRDVDVVTYELEHLD